ncbi:MAG TPA: 2-dehydropantoate 2-reductase N-terminal domain-containing protein, partial [Burkholderiales bacterium]|nr:2-dehydropantoate 2-reductase N-terminal domain-containing protein [Burkholderiales bacterium]
MAALAVLGAGAWGTALAAALSSRHRVTLWARDPAQAAAIASARRNARYLPEIALPEALRVEPAFERALEGTELLVAAT